MKKILTILLTLLSLNGFSQMSFNPEKDGVTHSTPEQVQDRLNKLKGTTTIVSLEKNMDSESRERLIKIFDEYWNITPYKIVLGDSIKYFTDKTKYSFFTNDYSSFSTGSTSGQSYNYSTGLVQLWMDGGNDKKGNKIKIIYSDLLLSEFHVYNFATSDYGFLLNYIQLLQKMLSEKRIIEDPSVFTAFGNENNAELKNLATATLYVPDFVPMKKTTNSFTGEVKLVSIEEDLFKKYPYQFKVVAPQTISSRIYEKQKSFYYLMYIFSWKGKFIYIVNGNTGDIIYAANNGLVTKIMDSDIDKIASEIKKASK